MQLDVHINGQDVLVFQGMAKYKDVQSIASEGARKNDYQKNAALGRSVRGDCRINGHESLNEIYP